MESTTKQIQAEIKEGVLIIDGRELRIEGLKNLMFSSPKEFSQDILSLSISIAKIGALMMEAGTDDKVDVEDLKLSFPSYSSLFALEILADSFKKM